MSLALVPTSREISPDNLFSNLICSSTSRNPLNVPLWNMKCVVEHIFQRTLMCVVAATSGLITEVSLLFFCYVTMELAILSSRSLKIIQRNSSSFSWNWRVLFFLLSSLKVIYLGGMKGKNWAVLYLSSQQVQHTEAQRQHLLISVLPSTKHSLVCWKTVPYFPPKLSGFFYFRVTILNIFPVHRCIVFCTGWMSFSTHVRTTVNQINLVLSSYTNINIKSMHCISKKINVFPSIYMIIKQNI